MAKPKTNRRNAPGAPDGTAAEGDLAEAAANMSDDEFPVEDGSTPDPGSPEASDADGATDPLDPEAPAEDDGNAPDGTLDPAAPIAEASNESVKKPEPKPARKLGQLKPGCPGIPSFDHIKGKPNLRGEDVHVEGKTDGGLKFVVTTGGRKIFLCSILQYEKEFGKLNPRQLWLDHFPGAAPKAKK